jgi:hypothetical protein
MASVNFGKSGSFTGPGYDFDYRDDDDFSNRVADLRFPDDVGMILVNTLESPDDYVYLHLNGTDTSNVTLDRSFGNISTFNVQASTTNFNGSVKATGEVTSNGGAHRLSNKKNFDIPHPNKPGWRLRHTCLEGPANDVYYRGRLTDNNVIELPSYWQGFVDPESITVSLTQIGSSQDLIVEKIEWGSKIIIKSGTASNIDCYYLIHGTRMDGEKLIVEYEGESPADYPGDNSEYSVAGYHYDVKEDDK